MSLVINDDLLTTAHISAEDLFTESVILLFQQERLTLGQSSTLLGIDRIAFQHLLAQRKIPVHYGVADFEADIATLQRLGLLSLWSPILLCTEPIS